MMTMVGQKYLRGQVWFIRCDNTTAEGNHIQQGSRPAVIVSNNWDNRISGVIRVVPMTSREKPELPTHVCYSYADWHNTILCEQAKAINKKDILSYMYTLSEEIMTAVDRALDVSLGRCMLTEEEIAMYETFARNRNVIELDKEVILSIEENNDEDEEESKKETAAVTNSNPESQVVEKRIVPEPDAAAVKPVPRVKPKGFWTEEMKQKYIAEYDSMSVEEIMVLWSIPSIRTAHNYRYMYGESYKNNQNKKKQDKEKVSK